MANVACGRITVFGKPNFGEYNFSIPIPEADRAWVEYPNERSIRTIPGNNNYTIYGGDGNVSLVFPPGEQLKLTIWDKENFSGNKYEFTNTCAGPINRACGTTFSPSWTYAKSMRVERLVFMTPTCKNFASIRPGDSGLANTACGRITVFGKPNFGEYNFSIPIPAAGKASVEFPTERAIKTIPGNQNYTIYGGDGNVSLAFPPGENLKMTIWDKENFSGNKYEFTKTCAGPINTACGTTFSPSWTYAKSIRVERSMPTTAAPPTTTAGLSMKPLMALPAEPHDIAYTAPSAAQGPAITVLDDNFVNAKAGQEGRGAQAGFPKGNVGVGYNIYDSNRKLIGPVQSVIFSNRNSGSAEYHTITLIFAKNVTGVSFSGNPSFNANRVFYAPPVKKGGRRHRTQRRKRTRGSRRH
jgi:hypothetical protein